MANEIAIVYEDVRRIASDCADKGQTLNTTISRLSEQINALRSTHWKGNEADRFFQQMDTTMERLNKALRGYNTAEQVITAAARAIATAENDACGCLPQ